MAAREEATRSLSEEVAQQRKVALPSILSFIHPSLCSLSHSFVDSWIRWFIGSFVRHALKAPKAQNAPHQLSKAPRLLCHGTSLGPTSCFYWVSKLLHGTFWARLKPFEGRGGQNEQNELLGCSVQANKFMDLDMYIYIYMHIYVCAYIYNHICIYKFEKLFIYSSIYLFSYLFVLIHLFVDLNIYIYIYALSLLHPWKGVGGTRAYPINKYMYVCMHACMYVCMHMYVYVCICM